MYDTQHTQRRFTRTNMKLHDELDKFSTSEMMHLASKMELHRPGMSTSMIKDPTTVPGDWIKGFNA